MTPAEIEKAKLIANACDRPSTACFIGIWSLIGGLTGWIIVGIGLHPSGETRLEPDSAMNAYWILAFVVTPAIILFVGYLGVLHFEWSLDRNRQAPGE